MEHDVHQNRYAALSASESEDHAVVFFVSLSQ